MTLLEKLDYWYKLTKSEGNASVHNRDYVIFLRLHFYRSLPSGRSHYPDCFVGTGSQRISAEEHELIVCRLTKGKWSHVY